MKKEILERIKKYAESDPEDIEFADGIDTFDRIVSCDKKSLLEPTIETGDEYSRFLDLPPSNIKGFYTGDPDDWLPVLLADGFIRDPENVCIASIRPEKGTPIIKMERHKNLESSQSIDLMEQFVISESPLPIIKSRKLSKSEISKALEIEKDWGQDGY